MCREFFANFENLQKISAKNFKCRKIIQKISDCKKWAYKKSNFDKFIPT